MTPFKIAVKLFTVVPTPPLSTFIPVFHQWIRDQNAGGASPALPNHLLIDVADYAHVQNGPGVVLVSSEANIYIDENGGRAGLLYVRKTPAAGDFADRLRDAVAVTIGAAAQLEKETAFAGALKFQTNEIQVRLNDRLLTPNNDQTLQDLAPAFDALAQSLYPNQPVEVRSVGKPRDLFTMKIAAKSAPSLAEMALKTVG